MGFTKYLVDEKMGDQDGRKVIDRILSCVNGEFENNPDVAGKDFNLYVTGQVSCEYDVIYLLAGVIVCDELSYVNRRRGVNVFLSVSVRRQTKEGL